MVNKIYASMKNQLLNLPTEYHQHNTLKFSPISYWIWTLDVMRHNWHKCSLAALTHITAHFQHHPIYSHNPNTQGMSCFRNHECQSPFIYLDADWLMEEYSRCCDENMYPSQKMGQTLYIWCLCDTLNLPVRLLFSLDLHRSVDSWI